MQEGSHFSLATLLFSIKKIYSHPSRCEKAMAPHSSTLAWKIPWMEEPSRLQSMGSLRVRHNWAASLSLFTFMHWRKKWQPAPVFLPGESQGRGSLVGCHLWGCRVGYNWHDLAAAAAVYCLRTGQISDSFSFCTFHLISHFYSFSTLIFGIILYPQI